MLRRGAVVSVVVALALVAAAPALAQDAHRVPSLDGDKALVEVKVPSEALYTKLSTVYDFTHAFQRNGDGSVSADVLANGEERRLLRGEGVQIVRTLEDADSAQLAGDERDATRAREARARELARTGALKSGKGAIPLPGEVVIQRAYTFTNYAGRFLYVEAHTKAATRRRARR